MSALTQTIQDIKADCSSVNVDELIAVAAKKAFELLDPESAEEVCDAVRDHFEYEQRAIDEHHRRNREIAAGV